MRKNRQVKSKNQQRNERTTVLLVAWLAALSIFFAVLYWDDEQSGSAMYTEVLIATAVLIGIALATLIVFLRVCSKKSREMKRMISKPGTYLMPVKVEEKEPEEIKGKDIS